MKKRQFILLGIALCLLVAVAWGFYLYNKPHENAGSKTTEASLSATDLYNAYASNEADADKKFSNKILEVKGTVQDISMSSKRPVIMLATGQMGSINCGMALDSALVFSTVHKNTEVIIKGKCSGYLMDVNLVDCVIK